MQKKALCPCCNESIIVTIDDDTIHIEHEIAENDLETSAILEKLNIELG